jgi:hypothetical protein
MVDVEMKAASGRLEITRVHRKQFGVALRASTADPSL